MTTDLPDLFPGFATHRLPGASGDAVHARTGGSGPPIVLLHGYPQTHVCWHRVAPALAEGRSVVVLDLRGYGGSDAPRGGPPHETYSKRAMAADVIAAMRALGHDRFDIAGHDRGARVAYRLALDHPDAVSRLLILDIVPTFEAWDRLRWAGAIKSYHWQFLAQPHPMPETMISLASRFYVDHTLASWTRDKTLDAFDERALTHYRANMADPARIHAMCEDYRAGASIDRALDQADLDAGRRISAPTHVLWGSDYLGMGAAVIDVWRRWADNVSGTEIASGHFLAEENPDATITAIERFLGSTGSGT